MSNTILEMRGITKVFPGVRALDDVSICVMEGEIHALVGENGAGKSTLMNVLSGIYPHGSYEGDILYDGAICRFHSIKDSEGQGIVIIHQELALVPYLSIAENMFLGNEQASRGIIKWHETYKKAEEYMRVVGLMEDPRTLVKDIGLGKQQLVEIAKALAKDVRLLILDEPTSSLNEADAKKLLNLLLSLQKTRGITSIIISHKLNEIAFVADKITVLRDGATIETLDNRAETISEERIIRGMVGRDMSNRYPPRAMCVTDTIALEAKNWTVYHPLWTERKVVDDVSVHVKKGEIVGIYGLIGAGRTELAMSIFGKAYGAKISGTLYKDGAQIKLDSIPKAIEQGLAYITEDRKGDGLVLTNSVMRNLTLSRMDYVSHNGIIDLDRERSEAMDYTDRMGIKTPSVEQHVGNLSGGNQQKVLLGKWIFAKPDVMLLDEPTRGVDVGAKYEIYQIIGELAANGKAVILISSELPEILGMCDRLYVMHEGRMVAELTTKDETQESVMAHILQANRGKVDAS